MEDQIKQEETVSESVEDNDTRIKKMFEEYDVKVNNNIQKVIETFQKELNQKFQNVYSLLENKEEIPKDAVVDTELLNVFK